MLKKALLLVTLLATLTALATLVTPNAYANRVFVRETSGKNVELGVFVSGSKKGHQKPTSQACYLGTKKVPCTSKNGWWHSSRNCYVKPAGKVLVETFTLVARGRDGQIMRCTFPDGDSELFWQRNNKPQPNPAVLARSAIKQMRLTPIKPGIAPFPRDEGKLNGFVGIHIWLWADEPSAQNMGPITKTVAVDGFSVTTTAKVAKIIWDMGDGNQVSCGKGSKWTSYAARGNKPSPTCGYQYKKQGRYTITAKSRWRVVWAGMGQSGVFYITRETKFENLVGEIHVLRVANPKKRTISGYQLYKPAKK